MILRDSEMGKGKSRQGVPKRQSLAKRVIFSVSLSINVLLLGLIFFASFLSPSMRPKTHDEAMINTIISPNPQSTVNTHGNDGASGLVCKQEDPGVFLHAPVSASPLSRGLTLGAHWYNLSDVIAFVSVTSLKEGYATFHAWGDILQGYGSYELFMMKGSGTPGGDPEVLVTGMNIPLPIPTNKYKVKTRKEVTLYVRELILPGKERSGASNSAKAEGLLRWVAAQIKACPSGVESPYCTRKWFVKANRDVFVIPKHLLALLSHYDAAEPICIANVRKCASANGCPRAAVYVLSAAAMAALEEKAWGNGAAKLEVGANEEVRMAALLEMAGVRLVDVGDAFFDRRMGERNLASPNPLVTLGGADDKMMWDYRALVNIEFKYSYFDSEGK